MAIEPEELEGLDDAAVRALYEQRLASQRAASAAQREVGPQLDLTSSCCCMQARCCCLFGEMGHLGESSMRYFFPACFGACNTVRVSHCLVREAASCARSPGLHLPSEAWHCHLTNDWSESDRVSAHAQDFSDLVAQKASQQKRKAAQAKEASAAKKQKESFKF